MAHDVLASVRVPGRLEWVRPTACFIVEAARNLHLPVVENRLFEVAVVEALTNALEHNVRDAEAALVCEFELHAHTLIVRVLDEGVRTPVAFAIPAGAAPWPEPTLESWESIPESGYGLYLMRAVFPTIRQVTRDGRHGIEMELSF
jgi:anti-sigma regulatory factor (Ser/Thr protein kinase)